jgi:hypothetical protein
MQPDPTMPAHSGLRPRPRWITWLGGMLLADIAVSLLYLAGTLVLAKLDGLGILGLPSFFLVPALGGLLASYLWRSLSPGIGATCLNTLWMTLLALAGAAVAFHEGVICLVIVFPLYFVSALAGTLLGRIWFKTHSTRLQVSFLPLLVLGVLAEPLTRADQKSVLTDEILIHASASKVWPQLTSFPEIPSPPGFWLFRLGLPYPTATTSAGDFVNADRQCIFSKNAVFKETVVELVPFEKLTFDIIDSPKDPELLGHLTLHRGQFVLCGNPDGTTTLVGSSWYTLHVRLAWYFDLWTRHIFRSVHVRVMEDIRRRAEASP